ncbi:hypothetical protein TRIP_E90025 [uncultured Spirochaetota bacterium]|uniref:Uncharacterized protein n=1 Tax=uncultured Spirochaetota bacterium TaxID=460511 RepID=A0A652ZZL2_9SPIR|nr:hypothetical protein TRIP_E90025 [uncultured Spirochaetota bacterium]
MEQMPATLGGAVVPVHHQVADVIGGFPSVYAAYDGEGDQAFAVAQFEHSVGIARRILPRKQGLVQQVDFDGLENPGPVGGFLQFLDIDMLLHHLSLKTNMTGYGNTAGGKTCLVPPVGQDCRIVLQ